MGELIVEQRKVVVPGEILAKGMEFLPSHGTYRLNDKIIANRLGLAQIDGKVIKLIPLSGVYKPKKNDIIIGQVIDILMNGWRIDTNCAYSAMLPTMDASTDFIPKGADLTQFIAIGNYVAVKISKVTTQKLVDLTMKGPGLRKLNGGRILKVNPYKVPRIIGKHGSMVSMIKQATKTQIVVGQNGQVWVNGEDPKNELLAVQTIEYIVENSHVGGLTGKIKEKLNYTEEQPAGDRK